MSLSRAQNIFMPANTNSVVILQLNLLKSCFVEKMSTVLVQYLGDALLVLGPEIAFSLNILNTRQAGREKRRGGGETCFPLDHVGQIPF